MVESVSVTPRLASRLLINVLLPVTAVLFAICVAWPSLAGAANLTLKDAITYALEHSPRLDSARQNRLINELNVKVARSKFLPSLDGSATHGLQTADPQQPTDPWTSQLSLSLSENLYDNGVTLTNFDISRINEQVAILQALQARDQLFLDVSTQYYQYSLSIKLAEVQKQQFEILQKKLRSISGQYREGMQTRKDYLRFKTQVQRAELDLLTAKLEIDKTSLQLRNLMGAPAAMPLDFAPVDEVPTEVPAEVPPVERSYEQRIAAGQLRVAPLQTRLAIRQYWPQLNLTSALTYTNNGYLNSGLPFPATHLMIANIQLGLTYNFLDWGQRADTVEIARHNETIAEDALRTVELQTDSTIKTLMLTLSELKANYNLSQELLAGEQTTYEVILRDYEEGRVQYLDLISSLSNLLDAKVRVFNAYYQLAQSLAQYHYYNGNLYETLVH